MKTFSLRSYIRKEGRKIRYTGIQVRVRLGGTTVDRRDATTDEGERDKGREKQSEVELVCLWHN